MVSPANNKEELMRSLSIVLSCLICLSGCASIVGGHNQSISIDTRHNDQPLSGATCELRNDKGSWYVTTPGSVTVGRSYSDLTVVCEKEGVDKGMTSVKSSTKALAFGNILIGGVIGAGVDIATGAAYDYPTLITVVMAKVQEYVARKDDMPSVESPKSQEIPVAQPSANTGISSGK
jgi:hypothetical protein